MKSTFNILFYVKRNEPKKDGSVGIMVRITIKGVRAQLINVLQGKASYFIFQPKNK